jgi:ribose transport system permease protein
MAGTASAVRMRRLVEVHEFGVTAVLVALCAAVAVAHPRFLAARSLANIGQQAAFFGMMALGMVFLLAMRELDLSVGSNYALSTIVAATLIKDGLQPWLGGLLECCSASASARSMGCWPTCSGYR